MIRQAREMIAAGELGDIRVVHAAYIQDWLTRPIDADGQKQAEWRTGPRARRRFACLADIGVHAHNLARSFRPRSRRRLRRSDDVRSRPRLDDNAHVLASLRRRRAAYLPQARSPSAISTISVSRFTGQKPA